MKAAPYILTHSGAQVGYLPQTDTPSIADISLGLSRMPRFAGQTRVPYTVLDHSLFVLDMVTADAPAAFTLQLAALLHDAHEAMTGDVPTPFKTAALRDMQDQLDARISELVCVSGWDCLFYAYQPLVKKYDTCALLAEALVIGPPSLRTPAHVAQHFGGTPDPRDVARLKQYMAHDLSVEVKRSLFAAMVEVLRQTRNDDGRRPGDDR
jgi:hypothetical protein